MEQHLLIWIADFYNDKNGMAYPSRKTLSEASCISVRTITRLSASLEAKGLIRVQECINEATGKNLSNRYFLPLYDPQSNAENPKAKVWLSPDWNREADRVRFTDAQDEWEEQQLASKAVSEWLESNARIGAVVNA